MHSLMRIRSIVRGNSLSCNDQPVVQTRCSKMNPRVARELARVITIAHCLRQEELLSAWPEVERTRRETLQELNPSTTYSGTSPSTYRLCVSILGVYSFSVTFPSDMTDCQAVEDTGSREQWRSAIRQILIYAQTRCRGGVWRMCYFISLPGIPHRALFRTSSLLSIHTLDYQPQESCLHRMVSATAQRLSGKTVLITGASSGIGKSTALEFARTSPEDLKLVLTARRIDSLNQLAEEINSEVGNGVKVLPVQLDISKPDQVHGFVSRLPDGFQQIDVLVNNA